MCAAYPRSLKGQRCFPKPEAFGSLTPKAFMPNVVKRHDPGCLHCARSKKHRTVIDGIGPTYRPTGRQHPRHQHQSGAVASIWAAINHTSALNLLQLHPAIYGCAFRPTPAD